MTQQQREAVAGLLRASPFDPAGDLREQRPLFEKMITAAPVPAERRHHPRPTGRRAGHPRRHSRHHDRRRRSCTSTVGSSPSARQRPQWAWPLI